MKIINDCFKDNKTHLWSLSKILLGMGFVVLSIVLIKMALLHEQEVSTCFIAYSALITGHDNLRRFLDKKKDENGIKE